VGSGIYIDGTGSSGSSSGGTTVTVTAGPPGPTNGVVGPGQGTGLLPLVPINGANTPGAKIFELFIAVSTAICLLLFS
jgi:hypothetical protein